MQILETVGSSISVWLIVLTLLYEIFNNFLFYFQLLCQYSFHQTCWNETLLVSIEISQFPEELDHSLLWIDLFCKLEVRRGQAKNWTVEHIFIVFKFKILSY